MNSCIFVVLVLLLEANCLPVGQDVLAGEDFLAVFMRSHRPRSVFHKSTTTESPTLSTVADTEPAATTLVTEPPQVVSVRVSSSVRKEAVHDQQQQQNELVQGQQQQEQELVVDQQPQQRELVQGQQQQQAAVSAAAQRSHFSVESSGYRAGRVEDSVAEASQDSSAQESLKVEENKPIAEALSFHDQGVVYESRVSSETSQSRIYFSQPKPSSQQIFVQPSEERKYRPELTVSPSREERKYEPQILTQSFTPNNGDRKYASEVPITQTPTERKSPPQILFTQTQTDRKSPPQVLFTQSDQGTKSQVQSVLSDQSKFEPDLIVTREETKYGPEIVVTQTRSESKYSPEIFVSQSLSRSQPVSSEAEEENSQQTVVSQTQETRKYVGQSREQRHFTSPGQSQEQKATDEQRTQASTERNYEEAEQNYEVDEAISVMTNGRAHGVQTESPSHKFGYVQEGRNFRKYRVEEKTPDGFIVGEYGVVNDESGGIRGVRYTADGSISPRLIYEALVKFLSLK